MQPPPTAEAFAAYAHPLAHALDVIDRLRARLRAAVCGRNDVVDLLIIALLADGHVLLEDYPGSGKTTLAKALGEAIAPSEAPAARATRVAPFRRVQFTPDLLPSDVTGTTVFDQAQARFFFRPGPVFAHVLLADEINRTSPKVQAALLEAMGEKQVTVDNETHPLDSLFFVVATQNPLDLVGTFPLPSAQLDRFLFKIRMTHIDRASELDVLSGARARKAGAGDRLARVGRDELVAVRGVVEASIFVAPAVRECLVDIAEATRRDERVLQGASTRSLVLTVPALQARALLARRPFVTADDVESLAAHIFAHRLETAPGVDDAREVVGDCVRGPIERLSRATLNR